MKKIFLTTTLLLIMGMICGQENQYNPYQHGREEYIQTGLELMTEGESTRCDEVQKIMEDYDTSLHSIKENGDLGESYLYLKLLSRYLCQESYDFFINMAYNDSLEENRCDALRFLAWRRNLNFIPVFQEYAKRDTLSVNEKLTLARAYVILGVHNNRSDLINEAVAVLDCFCYDNNQESEKCMWDYYKMGGAHAIKFFTYYLQFENSRLVAALRLAELGVYDITYPIFVEAVQSGEQGKIHNAIYGLAAIGSDEAFQILKELTNSKDELIAKQAKWIFKYIEIKRKEMEK